MKQYNTYQEAKIDNPSCDIYTFQPRDLRDDAYFFASESDLNGAVMVNGSIFRCNPADYCMSLEQFFDAGHKLFDGDIYLDQDGHICIVGKDFSASGANVTYELDYDRYILRAKSLEKSNPEWANGDECIRDGKEYVFVGMTPTFNDVSCIIFSKEHGIRHVDFRELRKPTPEDKAKREALELFNAKASYNIHYVIKKLSNAGMLKSKGEK